MSQETYTFACPVCAVRLSVPKALAGVRGPCPQCHHDITAPEPESVLAPALVGAAVGEARSSVPPVKSDGEAPSRLVPPPLPREEDEAPRYPPSLPEAEIDSSGLPNQIPGQASAAPSPPLVIDSPVVTPAPPDEAEVVSRYERPDVAAAPSPPTRPMAPAARRSHLGVAVTVLLVLGLLAIAALNLFPRHSLRLWLGKVLPSLAGNAAMAGESDGAPPLVRPAPLPASAMKTSETAPAPIEIRPALTSPETGALPGVDAASDDSGPAPSVETPLNPAPAVAEPTPEAATPTPPAPAAIGTAPELAAAAASSLATDSDPPETDAPSLLPDISEGAPPATPAINEAQAGALEALTLFLQARTWKDRLVLSHGGDSLDAEMEAYYRKAKDDANPPTSVEHIASAPLPDGVRTVQVFHVTFPDLPQGFPVPVRQTDEGWKIDWQAFVEFREGRLKKFLAQYQDAPGIFRVRLQRAHYQDRAVPKLDDKYIFRIAAPIDGHEGYVFVEKDDSILGPKLENKLEWDTLHHVMVKLKWVRGTTGRSYVELRDIVSNSWREEP